MNKEKQNEKILDELEFGYSCEKVVHQGWVKQEKLLKSGYFDKLKKDTGFVPSELFGKWQYVYRSNKGWISLIRINISIFNSKRRWVWEMWSKETLFPDTRRFKTKKEAEKEIRRYLC